MGHAGWNALIAYQGGAPMKDISKQNSPAAKLRIMPSQKKEARSDRLMDTKPRETVPVVNALLADQIKNMPPTKNKILFIAE
jgi:hypothetical protein